METNRNTELSDWASSVNRFGNRNSQQIFTIEDLKWIRRAEQELCETPDIYASSIEQLRGLLQSDVNLRYCRQDDAFLLRYLRSKKFDVEKAHRMVGQ